jgi:hypothetical protein
MKNTSEGPRILAGGYVLMVFLFDCFVMIPDWHSCLSSVSARRVLEEKQVNRIQVSRVS